MVFTNIKFKVSGKLTKLGGGRLNVPLKNEKNAMYEIDLYLDVYKWALNLSLFGIKNIYISVLFARLWLYIYQTV